MDAIFFLFVRLLHLTSLTSFLFETRLKDIINARCMKGIKSRCSFSRWMYKLKDEINNYLKRGMEIQLGRD